RDDRHEGDVAGDVVEVLRRREGIGGKGQEDAGEDDGDQHPDRLAAQFRRDPALLFLLYRLVEGDRHHSTCSMAPVISPVTSSGELDAICLSATLRPRRITMTRSATVNTSGMRWLMR